MKNLLVILVLLLVAPSSFGQKVPITYVNYYEEYRRSDSIESPLLAWDDRISEVILKNDTEFVFWTRPTLSCFTWRDYHGTWKRNNDTLVFLDQYEVSEHEVRLEFSDRKKARNYLLKFKTDENSVLSNRTIEIRFLYDIDARLENIERSMTLADDNSLEIPFESIPNRRKLASIEFKYYLANGEERVGYFTENRTLNLKEQELPNTALVTFIENPKKEIIYRTTKAILEDNKIRILSKVKTKSDLPDFTGEIKFKKEYQIASDN